MSPAAGVLTGINRALVEPLLWRLPIPTQRRLLELGTRGLPVPRGTEVHRVRLGDRPADRVGAPGIDESRAVLHLHGGAWVTMSSRTHRAFAAHLSAASGHPVFVLDQRLAPEHPHPADLEDALAAFDALSGPAGEGVPTALCGDSAGGALALQTALALRDRTVAHPATAQPTAVALVSPCADFTQRLARAYDGPDPLLNPAWLRAGRDAYLGTRDPRELSPLLRDLSGLPPMLVQWVTHERLAPESAALVLAVRAAGGVADGDTLPGLFHDVQLYAGIVPEATAAVRRLGQFLRA